MKLCVFVFISGKDYALGGIEFYNKALQRNMAIRTLMGSQGEKYYTKYGNHVTGAFENVVNVTERRENLIKHFSKYVEKEEQKEKEEKEKKENLTWK